MSIAHPNALNVGYILEQKYKILSIIEFDVISCTYLVEQIETHAQFAIKEYLPKSVSRNKKDNQVVAKDVELYLLGLNLFVEEAKKLQQFVHPNLVNVTEVIETNNSAYIVKSYVEQPTLEDWMEKNQFPSHQKVKDILLPLLDGLKYAHDRGVLHADINPKNILITEDELPILQNFGFARYTIATKYKTIYKTVDKVLTPPYSPIELYDIAAKVSASTDLYSLCVCLYKMITGKLIPEATDRSKGFPLVPLSEIEALQSKYPASFLADIDKNLFLKATARDQSVDNLRNSLLGIEPVVSQPLQPDISMDSEQTSYKNKIFIAILALLAVAGVVFAANHFSSQSAPTEIANTEEGGKQKLDINEYRNLSAVMTIQGSSTIGAKLMPELLTSYFQQNNTSELGVVEFEINDKKLIYVDDKGKKFAIDLRSQGSSTGIKALLDKSAHLAMSSRKIKSSEVKKFADKGLGDMTSDAQEIIIGLDGIAVVVSKSNPVDSLTLSQIKDIFTGKITNWSEVGGNDQKINLYVRDEKSGTRDTFESLIMNKEKGAKAQAFEDSVQLSNTVSNDVAGIGYISLPYINSTKALAISASDDSAALLPSVFTVSTEDYPLSRRLYLYLPKKADAMTRMFSNFVLSEAGQQKVREVGFVDIIPDLVEVNQQRCDDSGNSGYKALCQYGKRMDTNFRFAAGSSELDNKSKQALRMIVDRLNDSRMTNNNTKFGLIGFTDNDGLSCVNNRIAQERALIVAAELEKYGVKVDIIQGMGPDAPVADNSSEIGRDKNRRVELWTIPADKPISFPAKNIC